VQNWMEAFVIVATVAIIIQMGILLAMYIQFREMNRQITRISTDLQSKIEPILVRVNRILEDSQDRIASIVGDAAEITRIARLQAQKVDRVFTDAVERLRGQLIRGDHILTGALEVIEETGSKVKRTFWGPLQQASALLRGVMVGLDILRGGHRASGDASRARQDEELFI
jgi:hypothetical protein